MSFPLLPFVGVLNKGRTGKLNYITHFPFPTVTQWKMGKILIWLHALPFPAVNQLQKYRLMSFDPFPLSLPRRLARRKIKETNMLPSYFSFPSVGENKRKKPDISAYLLFVASSIEGNVETFSSFLSLSPPPLSRWLAPLLWHVPEIRKLCSLQHHS